MVLFELDIIIYEDETCQSHGELNIPELSIGVEPIK